MIIINVTVLLIFDQMNVVEYIHFLHKMLLDFSENKACIISFCFPL